MSDFGPPFSPAEETELLAAARKEIAEEAAAEAEEAAKEKAIVDMGEEGAVSNSADLGPLLDSAEAAEADAAEAVKAAEAVGAGLDPAPVDLQDAPQGTDLEDEGYESDPERVDEAKATAGGDAEAGSSLLEPVDILDDGSTHGSLISDLPSSSPPTPLDSINEVEEEGEGFFEGDPSPNVSPEGSADQVLGTNESSEVDDGPLPFDDEGLSQGEREAKEGRLNEKVWKRRLKKLAKEEEETFAAAAKKHQIDEGYVSGEDEDEPPSKDNDVVSVEPTPPASPAPTPPASTTSTEETGPFAPPETDRRVLKNSAARRVLAALFPGDELDPDELAARKADDLIQAFASAVGEKRFPIRDARKAQEDAAALQESMTVNERFVVALGYASAKVAESLSSNPPGSELSQRIKKEMDVDGSLVVPEPSV